MLDCVMYEILSFLREAVRSFALIFNALLNSFVDNINQTFKFMGQVSETGVEYLQK